jgi:hypothetical protein
MRQDSTYRWNLKDLNLRRLQSQLGFRVISSWYDPLGLLSPITIKYKIKLSEVIQEKSLKWDDDLGQELSDLRRELSTEIFNLPEFTFYRATKPANAVGDAEMIIFCDGAQPAYAACIYLILFVEEYSTCHFEIRLVAGKSRISKLLSTTRSELN